MTYIFISFNTTDIDLALSVRAHLEEEGLATWLDESATIIQTNGVPALIEDVIASAGVVLAIGSGVRDQLKTAEYFGKPIFYFDPASDFDLLIAQLKPALPYARSPLLMPLPQPLDTSEVAAADSEVRRRNGFPLLLLVAGAVVIVFLLGAAVLWIRGRGTQPETPLSTPTAIAVGNLPSATATETPPAILATAIQQPLLEETQPTQLRPLTLTALVTLPPAFDSLDTFDSTITAAASIARFVVASLTITEVLSSTAVVEQIKTATPAPTATATLTPSLTATETLTASPTPIPTATMTLTPTVTSTVPALDATLIPSGTENRLWLPIERQISGLTMVYVPGGCFSMIPGTEALCVEPFWITKTEVTTAEYGNCVASGTCTLPTSFSSRTHQDYFGSSRFADYPVINITWRQAQEFSQWIGGDLPSDVQWRYAAQGPSGWLYPWGNDAPSPTRLNYDGAVGDVTEVGMYPSGASWVGAVDLAGNVWEWTRTNSDQTNKIVCGGSWNSYSGLVSAVSQAANPETDSGFYTGFRVILDAASVQ